jgi:hypothetical protein
MVLGYLIHSNRLNPWIAGLGIEIVSIICFVLLITVKDKIAKYIFVTIATATSQSLYPLIWPGRFSLLGLLVCLVGKANQIERIRAARGTTTAGIAIGMTNVCPFCHILLPY